AFREERRVGAEIDAGAGQHGLWGLVDRIFPVATRAEILALSPVSTAERLDRSAADRLIRRTLRLYGSVQRCVAALAYEFGEHPETICPRMCWARRVVAELYPC